MKKDTRIIHPANYKGKKSKYGSVNPPIVRASTVAFESYSEIINPDPSKIGYGRYGIEPANTFKKSISDLEGAYDTILTSSGLQALSMATMGVLNAGDHLLIADGVYAPMANIGKNLLPDYGIEVSFFDVLKPENLSALVQKNTKAIVFETPSSLTMEFPDIQKITDFAQKHNLISIMDNTWGAGYLLKPLDLGVDISVQAITKYIVGHSDVMMGSIAIREKILFDRVKAKSTLFGTSVSPDDTYLALRGLKTLAVRLNQHHKNTMKVAQFLQEHPLVDEVFCPALSSSPGHENWKKYCTKVNGLFSFTFKENYGDNYTGTFIDNLEFFQTGYSWGGYESLILMATPDRSVSGWDKNRMVRLHIGLEDADDIIDDLNQSLMNL